MLTLYRSVTGCSGVMNIEVATSHSSQVSTAVIECTSISLDIGDSVIVDLGYTTNHKKLFEGYVKQIEIKYGPTKTYVLTCSDVLIRAIDFFIASSNPNSPFKRSNIAAEKLVQDVLELAQLTDYDYDETEFTFAVHNPLEVNLTSAYDYCRFISDIIAWHFYADENGTVHFVNRQPYLMGGDAPEFTITDTQFVDIKRTITDKNLRNRVVIYGKGSIYAEAKASSPYLPTDFYRTAVVAAPTVFDTQSMANQAASRNLTLLNRLTQSLQLTCLGNPDLLARKIVTLNHSSIGASGDWYVFAASHSFGSSGYTTTVELRK